MAIDYAALKTELQTDPATLGYATKLNAGDEAGAASLINAPKAGVSTNLTGLSAGDLAGALDRTEFAALAANDKTFVQTLISCGLTIPLTARLRADLAGIFGAGTATRTALASLQTKTGSRAEQLFGVGTVVSASDVSFALRGAR